MPVKSFTFESDNDVDRYINYLIDNDLRYDVDETPEDAFEDNFDLSDDDIWTLNANHIAMWEFCDVSTFLDLEWNKGLWERFKV